MPEQFEQRDVKLNPSEALQSSPSEKAPPEASSRPTGPDIIPRQRIIVLATLAARVQQSSPENARAPKAVTTAIRELNAIARLARDVLAGKSEAEGSFRSEIRRPARGFLGPLYLTVSSTTAAGRPTGTGELSGRPMFGRGGVPGRGPGLREPCGELLAGAEDVLQVAFQLDVRDGDRKPARTSETAKYLRTRMGLVAQFENLLHHMAAEAEGPSAEGVVGGPGAATLGDFGGFGDPSDPRGGFGGPSEPILPPDTPPVPPLDTSGLEPNMCETVGDLCVALFEESVAAILGDPYLDLLASVEPDCICHDYDPNQVFVGRPEQGRAFPMPLPADVRLIFRGQDITANIVGVTAQELRFRIPPNSQTGNIFLRGPLVNQPSGGSNLERLCGFSFPDFPGPLNPDTPVLINIIHPPVIDSFTVDNDPGPIVVAESCRLLNLCWQVQLSDLSPSRPVPACARIDVVLRNQAGDVIRQDGPRSCVTVTSATEETFMLEARSFAGSQECGHAGPVSLTIQRVSRLYLVRDTPNAAEVIAGTSGRFLVEVSCPAPEGGLQVQLTSSQPQVLQVPASVPIPAGQTRMPVDFMTSAGGRGPVIVRAMASGHLEGRLEYELVQSPAEICQAIEVISGSWARSDQRWSNWGVVDSSETFLGFLPTPNLYRPTTQYELAHAIQQSEAEGKTVRALGSGWGFSKTVLPQTTAIQGAQQVVAEALRRLALGGGLSEAQLHNFARNFSNHFGNAIDTTTLDRSLQPLLSGVLADNQDPAGFFFVEAGMTINFLNTLLDEQSLRLALRTMGGSSGQTIAGAFSTGTHGGDFDRPPLADAVRAIYLVGTGGVHHWIEPANPITDPTKLRMAFPCLAGNIHYDDDMFRSVLVSMGSMGVIYAVILEVVPQYSLLQWNRWSTWETFKAEASPNSFAGLFDGTWTGMRDFLRNNPNTGNPPNRFAQVVVNPIRNQDGTHNCYVSNRVELPLQERRGVVPLANATDVSADEIRSAITNSPEFGHGEALNFHFHGPSTEGSQLDQLVALLVFCKENNYPWAVRAVTDLIMRRTFPEPGNPPNPTIDIGYRVMAGGGTDRAFPTLGGTSVEAAFSFFPTVSSLDQPGLQVVVPDVISFVDTVLASFDQGVDGENKIFPAGWVSLRVTGRTAAFLGMERFEPSGMVEVSLIGRPDGYATVRLVEQLARSEGGALHWGQSNGMVRFIDLESAYGNTRIDKWKAAQQTLGGNTFSNLFMRRCGLA